MASVGTEDSIRVERRGDLKVYHRGEFPVDALLDALHALGKTLKVSKKSVTREVRGWVIKESRPEGRVGCLKRTLLRPRYRRGWAAANYLMRRGIPVPKPVAFVEKGRYGLIAGNALVSEYLDGYRNVEEHAKELVEQPDAEEAVPRFLLALAQAINGLCDTGAYHSDLSGKNIFTRDGETFYFIDLDGVFLHRPLTDARRMRNHVQVYDSFCDFIDDEFLAPFLSRMLPPEHRMRDWLPEVREAQRRRRAQHLAGQTS